VVGRPIDFTKAELRAILAEAAANTAEIAEISQCAQRVPIAALPGLKDQQMGMLMDAAQPLPAEMGPRSGPTPSLARPGLSHGRGKQRSHNVPLRRIITQELAKDVAHLPNRHLLGGAVIAGYYRLHIFHAFEKVWIQARFFPNDLDPPCRIVVRIDKGGRVHRG